MKRIIMFVLLFAALKVAGQTTGYLRFDTVKIMKQNGTCELYIINKTKDSLGLLTNVGGGLTRFIKPKVLNDSTLIIGLDTLVIPGATGSGSTGPPSLTYKYNAYGGVGGVLSPGEAAYTYDSITNKLSVDSADLIQTRQDSAFYRKLSPYPKPDTVNIIGNSHADAQGASALDSGFAYRESVGLGAVPIDLAVSGTGATSIASRFLAAKNPGNITAAIVMDGFNDPRRNGLPRKTLNKIINSHKAIFANQYAGFVTNAGTGGVGVTRSGSWTNSWPANGEGGKMQVGAYTNVTNDSISFTRVDSTFIIGVMGGDGSGASYIGTDVDVRIDGGPISFTFNTNDQTDGVADGSGLDNKRCAMAFIITGLSYGSHTITLIKKSTGGGGYLICDYFGSLVDKSQAQLMLWHHIPKMTAAGYATAPANATDATTDTVNVKIDSLKTTYPISIYPTYIVPTNTVYDPDIDADPDGIHMANSGHRKIADLALYGTLATVVPAPTTIGAMYFSNEFRGITEDGNYAFLMREDGDKRYIANQVAVTQVGDFKISGTAESGKVVTAGSVFSGSLVSADRQTNGVTGGMAGGGPVLSIRSNAAATNIKTWDWFVGSNAIMYRLLSDDLNTATEYIRVVGSAGNIDSIKVPKLEISGKLYVKTHDIASNSDSAVVRNSTTGEYEYAKINGGADGNGIYGGNGSLPSDVTVSTAGFTTTWTGTNDSETSFSVVNNGTTNASAISGTANGTTSVGVTGNSGSYIGVFGSSTSSTGVQGQSSSGVGVIGVSSTGAAIRGQINPSSTNAIENAITILRTTSAGAGANGLGAAIQYELETATSGTSQIAGSLAFKWTDATNGTRTSMFEIHGVNSGTLARKAALAGNGQWTWDGYGSGTLTGTPAYSIQATSSGAIIEGPLLAAGTYTPTLTGVTNVTGTTAYACQYMRVGNVVTVSGKLTIDYTATGLVQVGISLPIASAISNDFEVAGTGSTGTNPFSGAILGDDTNNRAQFDLQSSSSGSDSFFFTFTYQVL